MNLLTNISNYTLSQIGGKAYSLQNLISLGISTPKTFVITTAQVETILSGNFQSILHEIDENLNSSYEYAVRSSGIAEDNKDASYAGMFDTYLNVTKKEIFRNIKLCIESANNKRLYSYEEQKGIQHNNGIAIIIQEMINPIISGVAFTKDPVSENCTKVLIELGYGLGDKLVSGEITPVLIEFIKTTEKLVVVDSGDFPQFILEKYEKHLFNLIETSLILEKKYHGHVDIEFALDNSGIYILQSRPILKNQTKKLSIQALCSFCL